MHFQFLSPNTWINKQISLYLAQRNLQPPAEASGQRKAPVSAAASSPRSRNCRLSLKAFHFLAAAGTEPAAARQGTLWLRAPVPRQATRHGDTRATKPHGHCRRDSPHRLPGGAGGTWPLEVAVGSGRWKRPLAVGSGHCPLEVAVDRWKWPLTIGSGRWKWALAIGSGRWLLEMATGSDRWPLEVAVGRWKWPLAAGSDRWPLEAAVAAPLRRVRLSRGLRHVPRAGQSWCDLTGCGADAERVHATQRGLPCNFQALRAHAVLWYTAGTSPYFSELRSCKWKFWTVGCLDGESLKAIYRQYFMTNKIRSLGFSDGWQV